MEELITWFQNIDWNEVLNYAIKVVSALLAGMLATYTTIIFTKLKRKIMEGRVKQFIEQAVKAAEQLFPNTGIKRGTEKFEYVVNLVLEKFKWMKDEAYLKALIEGAVFDLTEKLKQEKKEKQIENKPEEKKKNNIF